MICNKYVYFLSQVVDKLSKKTQNYIKFRHELFGGTFFGQTLALTNSKQIPTWVSMTKVSVWSSTRMEFELHIVVVYWFYCTNLTRNDKLYTTLRTKVEPCQDQRSLSVCWRCCWLELDTRAHFKQELLAIHRLTCRFTLLWFFVKGHVHYI